MARVVLAMSGGVDSSVAAHLLLDAGHEVVGVFMRHGERSPAACCEPPEPVCAGAVTDAGLPVLAARPSHKQGCCSASDAEDARRVADRLEIPFYALDLQQEFRRIIDYFVSEYTRGRTPNPCVMCNNWLKFGRLFDYADDVGAQYVATGHYARLVRSGADGKPELRCGADPTKDQSYVLFGIRRPDLRRMLLPVGGHQKSQIRQMAAELGLRVAEKRDSQEICFVSGKHADFTRDRRTGEGPCEGEIVTTDGRLVGHHQGLESFTVGQRKGLGVALGEPYFVVRIEPQTRRVVLGRRHELARREVMAAETNWLIDPPRGPFRCRAKIRYNAASAAATAELVDPGRLQLAFDDPCYGVAPGQAVVCYDGQRVLGGGWIE